MPTVDERLASLEARMDALPELRNLITELRGDMNAQFADVRGNMNARFTDLRTEMNARFIELRADMSVRSADVNTRFVDVNARLTDWREDMNRRFDEVSRRFAALDQKGDRHFHWMVSTQVALLLAVVGALVGAYYR